MTTRSNGLPALRELPIKFTRRPATEAATAEFAKLVGKETDRAKHSPHEYVSQDERWIVRSVHHTGYGTSNNGRVRWHVIHDGHYFSIDTYGSRYALTLEDAIDGIHRRIGKGFRDGFAVLTKMRKDAEDRDRDEARRTANLSRAKDLLGRVYSADPGRLIEQITKHVDLDALARAIEAAEEVIS